MISPNTAVVVIHNIEINGKLAFEANERVIVEQVSSNPQRPDYRYVVLSRRMNSRFQLSDKDVREELVYQQIQTPAHQQPDYQPVYAKPKRDVPWKVMGIVVSVIVLLVVGLVVGFSLGNKSGAAAALNTWIKACTDKDTATLYDMTPKKTKDYVSQGDLMELISGIDLGDMSHIKIKGVKESGDTAMATIENTDSGDTLYWSMLKEDGKWKMDMAGSTDQQNLQQDNDNSI